jgi:hypothetical protein
MGVVHLEFTMKEVEEEKDVQELLLVLPFFLSLSFSNPFSNLPSLVSRVLACS